MKIRREFWRNLECFDALPEFVEGTIVQWTRVAESTLKIDWPDGYDIERLAELLAPAFNFEITANASGGPPPRPRGAAAAAAPTAAADVQVIKITYKDGVVEREQSWRVCFFLFIHFAHATPKLLHARPPCCNAIALDDRCPSHACSRSPFDARAQLAGDVKVDARPIAHARTTLKAADPAHTKTGRDMFRKVMFPSRILQKMIRFCNQRLSGMSTTTDDTSRHTNEGELLRFFGYKAAVALHQDSNARDLWRILPQPKDVKPPMALNVCSLTKEPLPCSSLAGSAAASENCIRYSILG